MAIINEINGDLDEAIGWAQKAYEDHNNKLALEYVRILRNRQARSAQLKRQEAYWFIDMFLLRNIIAPGLPLVLNGFAGVKIPWRRWKWFE